MPVISPKVEESRIQYALRGCRERGLEVFEPNELIKNVVAKFGDCLAVSCSFGACSVVVLHMALQIKPDIKVIFNNTGVEYPETYVYRDSLIKKWDLNLIETKPIKPFWQCVKEYGFPLIRTMYSRKGSKRKYHKPECCVFLKDKPMGKACKDFGIKATITGLRASESRVRMFTISQRGMYYQTKKWADLWRCHPVAFWNHKQVWGYLQKNGIPMNEVYTKLGLYRSGCMPCTGFINWEKQLARINPKMYHYIQKLRGVSLIDDFIELENEFADKCGFESRQELLEEWF